ncbi:MAG: hypothetical protein MO847_04200 [Candidatus Protistobacter heckmanni]|nr:hypothetical protein [Candidatus Protistobacter heckmanni]
MEISGVRQIAAQRQQVWKALNDPAVLKACLPGCESVQADGADAFRIVLTAAIGPLRARFNGVLKITDAVPPASCTLLFEGQGGAMGFGKSSAAVTLAEAAGGTELRYTANAQVGGKLAQVGARLIDSVARKLSDDFFVAFGKQFAAPEAAAQPAAAKPAQVSAAGASANAPANPQAGAQASAPGPALPPAPAPASWCPAGGSPSRPPSARRRRSPARCSRAERPAQPDRIHIQETDMTQENRRRQLMLAAAGAAAASIVPALPAHAQQPNASSKIVRIFVGFPPGQATDIVARLLAERLTPITGYNYIVDNRPGQGGSLALGVLAKSPPDGNTMMLAHMSAMCTNPHLYKSVPYDSLKDFDAAGLVGDLPFVLVCNPSIPAQTLPELIAYAKANLGKLTNGSSGNGTVSHLAMEEFKRKAGVDIVHIPYKGSSQNLADVVGGTVSIALETAPAVQAFVQSGKLRALAAGTSKRLAAPLAVPTLAEYGITGINAVTWLMLLYPNGTAKPMIHSTFEAANNIVRSPQVVQRFAQLGVLPRSSASPEEAAAYIRSEYAAWGAIVKRSGTTLD